MFPTHYEDAVQEWIQIREQAKEAPFEEALHIIHNWWQQVPLVQHNLHISDYKMWPGPWELLADKSHCEVARALQICYTVLLIERSEINSMNLLCTDNYTYVQIMTDGKEYVLNDQPRSITADLDEVQILRTINCKYFKSNL